MWTLLSRDEKRWRHSILLLLLLYEVPMPNFHKHGTQHITNAEVSARTFHLLWNSLEDGCLPAFGCIARLTQGAPTQVGLASSHSLGQYWKHQSGHPSAQWTDPLRNNTGSFPANLRRQAILWSLVE